MTINTFFLLLLVIAAYTNLYLTFKKKEESMYEEKGYEIVRGFISEELANFYGVISN